MDERLATRVAFGFLALAGVVMLGAAAACAIDDARLALDNNRHEWHCVGAQPERAP